MSDPSAKVVCEEKARQPISIADLFTVGLGPSSSHTVGPMRAAQRFMTSLLDQRPVKRISVKLYGSLALTGKGHQTDKAVILGLGGFKPEAVGFEEARDFVSEVCRTRLVKSPLGEISFCPDSDIIWAKRFVKDHPNTLDFDAVFDDGSSQTRRYYSVGGGAIVEAGSNQLHSNVVVQHPFTSAAELLDTCTATGSTIAQIVLENERAWREDEETLAIVQSVRFEMLSCIDRGMDKDGVLPGGLGVQRRAKKLHADLLEPPKQHDPSNLFEWVSLWALAVNEENAAGGRVVTAPTNGAAGVIPAVLKYYETFVNPGSREKSIELLLTAAAVGFLYKKRASISAAEMGCQGEVGVACSMAAAGLAAAMGGTPQQVENAAEIGMEHNLGLTCDPIGGLVQIPCIERNTMGAVKAINAALLALRGDGTHVVSLDQVIETMRQTGNDMRSKYKETSTGGLAVNVVEC